MPTPVRAIPAAASASISVSPGGAIEKSRRFVVRLQAPGVPVNGRAITRETSCGGTSIARAVAQAA